MRVTEATRATAPATRVPEHARLGRLVARALGLDEPALQAALTPATLDDLPAVIALRREHLGLQDQWDDAAYLRWRYRLGRANAGFGELWCVRARGELWAIIGVETLQAELDGETVTGAQVMDLLVRPEAQDAGLGIWLNQAMLARHGFTLAVGANPNSAGIVRRMFLPLAPRLTFTHPLDLAPFVRRRWPTLARVPLALRLANTGLALRRLALRLRRPRGLQLRRAEALAPTLRLPRRPDRNGVHLQRNTAELQQRLLANPRRPLALCLAQRGQEMAGLIAWTTQQDDEGRPELHLIHWEYADEATLIALLHEALREAAQQRCSCVRLMLQDSAARRALQRTGFLPSAQDEGRPCGVQSSDAALAVRLAQARWRLTELSDDSDGF